jgi:hypothetical protein
LQSGNSGLQITNTGTEAVDAFGFPEGGSRVFQWGWNPVGGAAADDAGITPNNLVISVQIGTVTITTT